MDQPSRPIKAAEYSDLESAITYWLTSMGIADPSNQLADLFRHTYDQAFAEGVKAENYRMKAAVIKIATDIVTPAEGTDLNVKQ
jgi:hypothetical protein